MGNITLILLPAILIDYFKLLIGHGGFHFAIHDRYISDFIKSIRCKFRLLIKNTARQATHSLSTLFGTISVHLVCWLLATFPHTTPTMMGIKNFTAQVCASYRLGYNVVSLSLFLFPHPMPLAWQTFSFPLLGRCLALRKRHWIELGNILKNWFIICESVAFSNEISAEMLHFF